MTMGGTPEFKTRRKLGFEVQTEGLLFIIITLFTNRRSISEFRRAQN